MQVGDRLEMVAILCITNRAEDSRHSLISWTTLHLLLLCVCQTWHLCLLRLKYAFGTAA